LRNALNRSAEPASRAEARQELLADALLERSMGWDGAGAYARRAVARRSVHAADEASEMPGGERRTGCPLRRIGAPRAAPALSVGPRLWRECSPESGYKNERARSLAGPKPQPEHELVRVAIPSPHPPRAHSER